MSVLVTGGAGYIGSHMVWELLDAGEEVVVLDRLSTGFEWAVAPEAKLVVGDVGDPALVSRVLREHPVDAIIHFAGSVVVPESVANPLSYYANNVSASRTLIEAAARQGVENFIFSSTAAVYAPTDADRVREDFATLPESPYGRSKLMVEWMLRDAGAAHGLRYAILRYFNVAGADPAGRTGQSTAGATHLIKVACETALGKRPAMQIFGADYGTPDGTCVRDFIHVSDLAAAHGQALGYLRAGNSSLIANCGYGTGYSVRQVIDSVQRETGQDFPIEIAARRPGDLVSVVADPGLLKRELGWVPAHEGLDGIVASSIAWERHLMRKNVAQVPPLAPRSGSLLSYVPAT